jgi:hypothetical protein
MLYILFIINITYNNKHWTDLRMSQNIWLLFKNLITERTEMTNWYTVI